jgi:hypothetical protein
LSEPGFTSTCFEEKERQKRLQERYKDINHSSNALTTKAVEAAKEPELGLATKAELAEKNRVGGWRPDHPGLRVFEGASKRPKRSRDSLQT